MSVQAVVVDENGITVKSFNEIRQSVENDYKAVFSDLNTEPSSPDGMLIDLVAYAVMEVAQSIQAIYANLDATTAQGAFLTNLAFIAGFPRMEGEDDDSLRLRIATSRHNGLATVDTMTSYLKSKGIDANVTEILAGDSSSSGIRVLSGIRVFVPQDVKVPSDWNGSLDDFIASAIWDCKPAGVKTNGKKNGVAVDISGNAHTVYFSVIEGTPFSLRVEIKSYDEEKLPDNYVELIKQSIVNWTKEKFTPGKDIIPQRFCAPIYDNVDGIENVEVFSKKNGESGWTSEIVRLDSDILAKFSEDDIEVVIV